MVDAVAYDAPDDPPVPGVEVCVRLAWKSIQESSQVALSSSLDQAPPLSEQPGLCWVQNSMLETA